MKPQTKIDNSAIEIHPPSLEDGQELFQLANKAGGLDVNTEYAYLLLGAHFANTCAIAKENGETIGYTSAYKLPDDPETIFIWQIAISPDHRKRGLAKKMLKNILKRRECENLKYVHATVTPSNEASQNLFASLARDLGCEIEHKPFIEEHHFSGSHDKELLIEVGPLPRSKP